LNQSDQQELVSNLVDVIKNLSDNSDDQVRIAISIVQNIPYGNPLDLTNKYPYEVLYTDSGVCGEKSELLALILKNLGYGVAILNYPTEDHQAIGLKCPVEYSLDGTGYCFVETTSPTIITDDSEKYACPDDTTNSSCSIRLSDNYSVINLYDGNSFDSVSAEYNDAKEFVSLNEKADANGGYLSKSDYDEWKNLVKKYGIKVSG
jgi:hypothetical protein